MSVAATFMLIVQLNSVGTLQVPGFSTLSACNQALGVIRNSTLIQPGGGRMTFRQYYGGGRCVAQ